MVNSNTFISRPSQCLQNTSNKPSYQKVLDGFKNWIMLIFWREEISFFVDTFLFFHLHQLYQQIAPSLHLLLEMTELAILNSFLVGQISFYDKKIVLHMSPQQEQKYDSILIFSHVYQLESLIRERLR
mmetsp:Transcript_39151/g.91218  ORF Transcript_39151/g.91218 Transcript_39151/m.91218 type:complete len:128 (+) Transcript_39151:260-643(+)